MSVASRFADLAGADGVDRRVVGRAFYAAVPAPVVARAVAVVLAIRMVVLFVERNHVVQREAIMRGHEVHRRPGPPAAAVEFPCRGGQAGRHLGRGRLRLPEGAGGVAELVVPLRPARRELADLVAAGADIPRFGDQLHAGQHRVLPAGVQEAAALVEAVVLPRQDGGQVEAEPVHVHLAHPIAQAVRHHLQHAGVADVDGVAGAGVVHVAPFVAGHQAVIAEVVDPAERQRGPPFVALGGVIVHHVQDHLEPGVVEARDHLFELGEREIRAVGIARVRREERDGVVAPVVGQPAAQQVVVIQEGVHRQQLDRGHPERADVAAAPRAWTSPAKVPRNASSTCGCFFVKPRTWAS